MCLEPLLARVVNLFQDASFFGLAVSSRSARGAAAPALGIAKDAIVLDVESVLMVVLVEVIPTGLTVVANVLVIVTDRESAEDAIREFGAVLGWAVRVVAGVLLGVKVIKGSLVLEGSVKCGVCLTWSMGL